MVSTCHSVVFMVHSPLQSMVTHAVASSMEYYFTHYCCATSTSADVCVYVLISVKHHRLFIHGKHVILSIFTGYIKLNIKHDDDSKSCITSYN